MKDLKKKMFKVVMIIIITVCFTLSITNKITTSPKQLQREEIEKVIKKEQVQENNQKLEEELLRKKITKANQYVSKISTNTRLILLTYHGSYTIQHDRTPENNRLTDWFINADISMSLNYSCYITIDAKKIITTVFKDGSIGISYQIADIQLSAIDLSNIAVTEQTSLFGKHYTPSETIALQKIAKEKIKKATFTVPVREKASSALTSYLTQLATTFGIESNMISIIPR